MSESHLHHPQPPAQETGALEVVAHELPKGSLGELAKRIQHLLERGGIEESALHD